MTTLLILGIITLILQVNYSMDKARKEGEKMRTLYPNPKIYPKKVFHKKG